MNLRDLITKAEKPARYTGGEYGGGLQYKKGDLTFCMCFPDVYEIGMSNLGIRILSEILNNKKGVVCDRCFTPYLDFIKVLKEANYPLYSLELKKPLKEFDFLGFSLAYELSYTNVLAMLDLAGIPLLRAERGGDSPIIIAGGSCAVNPLPMVDFIDLFVIGDGEEVIDKLTGIKYKNKNEFLQKASEIEGVFVPGITKTVKKAIVKDLNAVPHPKKMAVANIEAVHDRAVVEVMRGCYRGCRFCQAGFIYRPVRERTPENASECAKALIDYTGFDEVSLNSLSTGDYKGLKQLISLLKNHERTIKVAFPSLRLDSFEDEFIQNTRRSSLTFAIEAGSERLRAVIKKDITNDEIFTGVKRAFSKGYFNIKLYLMVGLPSETDEDILAVGGIIQNIREIYKSAPNKRELNIVVSVSAFVPKPFTPFQWEKMISKDEFGHKIGLLKNMLRRVKLSYSDYGVSELEAVFARGDERLCKVLLSAYTKGCVLDGWHEIFCQEKWNAAFCENGINKREYLDAKPDKAPLAWEFVDMALPKELLANERDRARGIKY